MADHHLEASAVIRHRRCQGWKKHVSIGSTWGVNQNSGVVFISLEQEAVGRAAPFQGVFQLEAAALLAQAAQADSPWVDGQGDRLPYGCRGCCR